MAKVIMAKVIAIMSMSLDGYIAGPHDEAGNPDGGFMRLHEWFATASGPAGELTDEMNATGAVLVGRPLSRTTRESGRAWNLPH